MASRSTLKKALRWCIGILVALILLIVVAALSINPVAKSIAEKRLEQETGMAATIGKMELGFRSQSLRIVDLELINPPEFGGETFVRLPELFVEVDAEAFQQNRLRLRTVRIDLAEIHVVENKDGTKNTDVFQKAGATGTPVDDSGSTNQPGTKLVFAGIDLLDISLGTARFTSERYPNRNYERKLGVKNRTFKDIKTEKDLQTVGVLIAAQIGMGALLDGVLSNPGTLLKKGAAAGDETGEVLKDLVAPLKPAKPE